ncbi:MAG: hypothetical protein Tsb0020_29140 [Haliangiales bacterium]
MNTAAPLWSTFVTDGNQAASTLEARFSSLGFAGLAEPRAADTLEDLAEQAFRLGVQSLLLGAEALGQLALACERGFDLLRQGALSVELGVPILSSSLATLRGGFQSLTRSDISGARTDSLPLKAARYELETLFPVPGAPVVPAPGVGPDVPLSALTRRPRAAAPGAEATPAATPAATSGAGAAATIDARPGPRAEPPHAAPAATRREPPAPGTPPDAAARAAPAEQTWRPQVDDDMLDLFFDEVDERVENLAIKLLDLEQHPDSVDIVRDVFRDLHTLKGSSAMVDLVPMRRLAHAAEDLVGQVREGQRGVDSAVIDALLATLDTLRDITFEARQQRVLDADLTPLLDRLREPHAARPASNATAAATAAASGEPRPQPIDAAGAPTPAEDAPDPNARPRNEAARPTIRVDFDKLDLLMNLVGELVLRRDGLRGVAEALDAVSGELATSARAARPGAQAARALTTLRAELGRIDRVLADISQDMNRANDRLDTVSTALRKQVMKLRMVPVRGIFRKHHRTVRDLAAGLKKRAVLVLEGEDTELDKVLVEALDEPLMHLVRNAVDHGVEAPAARARAGKPEAGVITLKASHEGNQVLIQVSDDGRGLEPDALRARALERGLLGAGGDTPAPADLDDQQALELIFHPGFSTATEVSAVSGRGVGMDVVKQTIIHELKGTIEIDSTPTRGTTFTLRLPLTLAIIQVLLARAGGQTFAVPLDDVLRTIACHPSDIARVQNQETLAIGKQHIPLIRLDHILELSADLYATHDQLSIILSSVSGRRYGLICDQLLGKKEIVIKPLGPLLTGVPCAAGATLLGDRSVLILDLPAIVQRALDRASAGVSTSAALTAQAAPPRAAPRAGEHAAEHRAAISVLLAEDSDTVRESLRRLLVEDGYQVVTARDGAEALAAAERQHFDLVSTDVMMPRMDGYELTRALRSRPEYKDTPIMMITSRGERIDRVRGFDAGVDEYITKPHDRSRLLSAIRKLLRERLPR